MNTAPVRFQFPEVSGYALAFHTIWSTPLGTYDAGHSRFDTRRTEIGELLYQLKYQKNRAVLEQLIETAVFS